MKCAIEVGLSLSALNKDDHGGLKSYWWSMGMIKSFQLEESVTGRNLKR